MKGSLLNVLLILGLFITIFGLLTGKFYFLFLILPLGLGYFKKKEKRRLN